MRGIILIISALMLAALAAGVYIIMGSREAAPIAQGKGGGGGRGGEPMTSRPSVLGPGDRPYWTTVGKNGTITSQLRAARYEPMKDGRVKLFDPEAIFFLHKGEVLKVRGQTGEVIMQEGLNRGGNVVGDAKMSQQPRSGLLHGVTLEMYRSESATKPTATVEMNNASFESENVRVKTQEYEDGRGRIVPADEVPIHVRGDDYEFDGYGLSLQYNDVSRRLENLTISRGERLLIKNPRKFLEARSTTRPGVSRGHDPIGDAIAALRWTAREMKAPAARAGATMAWEQADDGPLVWRKGQPLAGVELAAADKSAVRYAGKPAAVRRAVAPRSTTRPVARPAPEDQVYRAIFNDAVEIYQAEQRIATADRMELIFINEPGKEEATTRPAGAPTGRPEAQPARPPTRPAEGAVSVGPATTQPAPAKRLPTTNPLDQPVLIRWKGPMNIRPVEGDRPEGLTSGEAIVKLIAERGKQVHVVREANGVRNNLRCASLTFWSIDHRALLESTPGGVVEMFDERGNRIVSNFMDISQEEGIALLGPGNARMAIEDLEERKERPEGQTQPREPMAVSWEERCNLYFIPQGERMIVKRAELDGKVHAVEEPQLDMRADSLDLYFDTSGIGEGATTRPARTPPLNRLRANGGVKCLVAESPDDQSKRIINCDNLDLMTARSAEGKLYARTVVATGKVYVKDSDRELTAGLLSANLGEPTTRPTTRPSKTDVVPGNFQSMIASENVHVQTKEGNTADCDTLSIHKAGGLTTAILTTLDPERKSQVKAKDGSLRGPIIRMVQETQELAVDGAGELEGKHQPDPQKPAQPVHVSWTRSLIGHGDIYDCIGNVELNTKDSEGAENTAKGDSVRLVTTTRPTTQPTTRPAAGKRASTRPAGELDIMANRDIRSMEIVGTTDRPAEVKSLLKAANGARFFRTTAERIQFFQPDEANRKLVIPCPGHMAFSDTRPPAKNAAAKAEAEDPLSMRGQMELEWKKSLVYDRAAGQIVMRGDVQVARLKPEADAKPVRLYGETIVMDVQEEAQPGQKPPAAAGVLGQSRIQIKKVHVEGSSKQPVAIISAAVNGLNIRCMTLDFDPAKHEVIVRGDAANPAWQVDESGMKTATFDEAIINTVTNDIKAKNLKGQLLK